jgi:hypothetical protein
VPERASKQANHRPRYPWIIVSVQAFSGRCVARPKSPAIAVRDDGIYAAWKEGSSLVELADKHGISPQRVGQIVAVKHPEFEDETSRAMHRGRLENLIQEIQGVIATPGHKMSATGRLVEDEDGNPVEDTSAKIEAMKVMLTALDSARKLDGLDKPVRKIYTLEHSAAEQQMLAAIEDRRRELADLARRAAPLQGEVLRELPPGSA